jgi:hypothetical protein
VRRIVIAGGTGFFGQRVAGLLREMGVRPVIAGRDGEVIMDVEDRVSLGAVLRADDVVVDAAGPFQARTAALIEVACEIGADVIDLNESLVHARRVDALADRVRESGIGVRSTCSAVSTVAAALVRRSAIDRPVRVSALVAPASRETAHAGTLRALLASVGTPIEVWRDGRFAPAIGWRSSRTFALPPRCAYLVASALPLTLPAVWPSLRAVDCWTDTSTPLANDVLALVARARPLRAIAGRALPVGAALARIFGTRRGAFAIEVEDEGGRVARLALTAERRSYLIAAAPAALAARALAEGRSTERGIVPVDRHVDPEELLVYLGSLGIALDRT